jgi:hypothetical protein
MIRFDTDRKAYTEAEHDSLPLITRAGLELLHDYGLTVVYVAEHEELERQAASAREALAEVTGMRIESTEDLRRLG